MPYLDHLKENMLVMYPNNWVAEKIREKYGAFSNYPCGEEYARKYENWVHQLCNNIFVCIINFIMHVLIITSICLY
jgi:hypothetical protein